MAASTPPADGGAATTPTSATGHAPLQPTATATPSGQPAADGSSPQAGPAPAGTPAPPLTVGSTHPAADPRPHTADRVQAAGTPPTAPSQTGAAATSPAAPAASTTASATGGSAAARAQHDLTGSGAHPGGGSAGHPGTPGAHGPDGASTSTAASTSDTPSATPTTSAATIAGTGGADALRGHVSGSGPERALVFSGVGLHDAADTLRATFTAATRAGISTARISLAPDSLGGIRISLSQTPAGLVARVAADHPEAVATLQQSAADLRRSLEGSGMSLLRLDIGASGQSGTGSFAGSAGGGSGTDGRWSGAGVPSRADETTSTPTELTLELRSGALVDVLA